MVAPPREPRAFLAHLESIYGHQAVTRHLGCSRAAPLARPLSRGVAQSSLVQQPEEIKLLWQVAGLRHLSSDANWSLVYAKLSEIEKEALRHLVPDGLWASLLPDASSACEDAEVVLIRSSFIQECAAVGRPLPSRQEIERDYKDACGGRGAVMSVDELRRLYRRFRERSAPEPKTDPMCGYKSTYHVRCDAVPIVAISYKWRTRTHPDPKCRTLRSVAAALESQLQRRRLTSSLVGGYAAWGFDEVGVFWDYASLYQKRYDECAAAGAGVFESPRHERCFKLAISRMTQWYCHALTTVYVVDRIEGDDEYNESAASRLFNNYGDSGWTTFERSVSTWFKEDSLGVPYPLCGDAEAEFGQMWARTLVWSHGNSRQATASSFGRAVLQPPMPPSEFEAKLRTKTFSSGSDMEQVLALYRGSMVHSYSQRKRMVFTGDALRGCSRRPGDGHPPVIPSVVPSLLRPRVAVTPA